MSQFENSDILKYVLARIIDISSRKTSYGNAISTINNSVKNLEEKFDFLKHVEIKNTQFSESDDTISILSDIDRIESNMMGRAIYEIIKTMNRTLGKSAGHFFMKELRSSLDDEYYSTISEMGIDLSLLQLEFEVEELEKKLNENK